MAKFSVVILTKNEEKNILDCLESVRGVDDIIVIDDNSEDRTLEVIKNFDEKIKIYQRQLENDFSSQRNFGLSKARNVWVLFLDADERLSSNLVSEIKAKIKADNFDSFKIRRTDVLWG